ncbi:uncharacterized protein LOC124910637 [Impatiens glandulifera]|uniref:uncharacterized protein LOC124910637 n=1 Tax=Impatiens glandulifera TaxID=253017 RepID=UPI001FB145AB|nr:uncharacterized protein LOC124910637 [Impatiens glandulifera]
MIADVKAVVTSPEEVSKIDMTTTMQLPCDDDDELRHLEISTREPIPRCVFGGPPTLQEAKAAASELKDALQKYMISNNGPRPTEIRTNHDRKDVLHMVELLAKTPKFQDMAVSLVLDTKIVNAVMNNHEVIKFMNSCQKRNTVPSLEMISSANEIAGKLDFIYDEPVKNLSLFWRLRGRVMDLAWNVKTRAVVMVSDLSKYVYNKLHTSSAAADVGVDDPSVESGFMDTHGGTLVRLAIIVIMIVVFKRRI